MTNPHSQLWDKMTGRSSRRTYNWADKPVGEWFPVVGTTEGPAVIESDHEAYLQAERIRAAARTYAEREGYRVETRIQDKGRMMAVRFTPKEAS